MAYRIVLFDIGNVLLKLKMQDFFSRIEASSPGLTAFIMEHELKRPGGPHVLFEVGKASFEEFHQDWVNRFGLTLDLAAFKLEWQDYFEANPEMEVTLDMLKGRADFWALTNTNPVHFEVFKTRCPVFKKIPHILASHELGFRKPDPQIFSEALNLMACPPAEVFFIDDLAANVEAARACGMQAFHYSFNDAELRRAMNL